MNPEAIYSKAPKHTGLATRGRTGDYREPCCPRCMSWTRFESLITRRCQSPNCGALVYFHCAEIKGFQYEWSVSA